MSLSSVFLRIPRDLFVGLTELYDLSQDIGETHNVADQHPQIVKKLEQMMAQAHQPHSNWKVK